MSTINNQSISSLTTKTYNRSIVNAHSRYWSRNDKLEDQSHSKSEHKKKKIVQFTDDHSSSDASNSDEEYESLHFVQLNKQRGATDKQVESLAKLTSFSRIEGACAICLQQWRSQEKCNILPCTHKYHKECIRDWLLKKNTCPCCKSVVFQ